MSHPLKIALVGNPNCGKTSVFNQLTGLRQKVGNFPGVTVEKKSGTIELDNSEVTLIDFPGLYSLFPNSQDERIVVSTLAVVKRETNSWKWPIVQFIFMTAMAYFGSWAAYAIFS